MGTRSKVFRLVADGLIWSTGLRSATKATCRFLERVTPIAEVEVDGRSLQFYCPNERSRWRATTLFQKEPGTIAWIESLNPGDVFFDVGASTGPYTIYAAARGLAVVAFEPWAGSYWVLNRNIALNGLSDTVSSLNVALSDITEFLQLQIPDMQEGATGSAVGDARGIDGQPFETQFQQGILAYRLDDLLRQFDVPFPQHLKIDVDGIEPSVIKGAKRTLADSRLRTVQIEVNERRSDHLAMVDSIEACGLNRVGRGSAGADEWAPPFPSVTNYLFDRG